MIYVGNLQIGTTGDALKEFTGKKCEKLELKAPKVYNCKIFKKEQEEGEIVEFCGARLKIDHASLKSMCDRHFWPGRVYARPWVFADKESHLNPNKDRM